MNRRSAFFAASLFLALPAAASANQSSKGLNDQQTMDQSKNQPAGSSQSASTPQSVSAKDILQKPSALVGKQVSLNGKIDRVLGNGAYLVSDPQSEKSRILILTRQQNAGTVGQNQQEGTNKQQAGMAAQSFKEGDKVQLSGKVEQLNVSGELDTFSPSTNTETITAEAANIPVVVVQPSDVHKAS